ncbi:glycosyltransferase involved in cell wall biosynthesis [Pseudoduganella lurida]|uniref:Glycosyltransferase involved in cell wall biosynthesis n=1 Tax=Pseudoduganella lurida TaxID=1036180 RepID=A0A562REE5_9BURK|nr:glycosyltransferase family 1 protein [Pseudoduganella lurida]TWI67439.1 glycosyltransferase involved in cell wall biosynthesis [Pseudoduganella lurida]
MTLRLLLTLDSMRFANTGLHTFGGSLARALVDQGGGALATTAYTYPAQHGFLGSDVAYVPHRRYHRWFLPRHGRYDVVHFADQYCRFGPGRVDAPTVMTVHDLNQVHERAPGSRKLERYLRRMRKRIVGVDRIVAISDFVKSDILRFFPEVAGRITVIHNGADASFAPDGHQPAFVPRGPFLFAVGMVCPKKNFHVLVPLLQGTDHTLVIAGVIKEPYGQQILAEAARLGVADRVVVTGPVSQADKDWYYAHCAAFLFPSLAEGFGLPVLEAMHHGRPVFLSRLTSLPEVGGDVANYFDGFDPDHMREVFAAGMARFGREDGAQRAREHAQKFTWENAARAYLDVYRDVLGR